MLQATREQRDREEIPLSSGTIRSEIRSLGANLRMWDRQVEALKSQFHIIRYDQRGHGRTTVPTNPFNFDDLSSDVIHLMNALEVSQANFVGLSMGGMTALGLGILHGSRFKSLTASNCVATFSDQARQVAAFLTTEKLQQYWRASTNVAAG